MHSYTCTVIHAQLYMHSYTCTVIHAQLYMYSYTCTVMQERREVFYTRLSLLVPQTAGICWHAISTKPNTLYSGPALASAGPDWKHFAGTTQWCVEIFEGVHQGATIKNGDVEKARAERMKPRHLQQRLHWTAPKNTIG